MVDNRPALIAHRQTEDVAAYVNFASTTVFFVGARRLARRYRLPVCNVGLMINLFSDEVNRRSTPHPASTRIRL
jgi:hypothetical protein